MSVAGSVKAPSLSGKKSHGRKPAVGPQDLPGHELTVIAEEEVEQGDAVLGLTHLLQGVSFGGGLAFRVIAQQRLGERGVGERGGDDIDANRRRPLRSEAAGECFERAFGGSDRCVKGHALGDGDGGKKHHRGLAAGLERGKSRLQSVDRAADVDLPILEEIIGRESVERLQRNRARAIHQAIELFWKRQWCGSRGIEMLRGDSLGEKRLRLAASDRNFVAVRE